MTMPTIKEDWQMMTADTQNFSARELAARAVTFDRQIRARNVREYGASAVVAGFFGWRATVSDGTAQVAAILLVLAALWTAFHIWRAGAPAEPDLLAPAETQRMQWRDELERQAQLLESVRWTYLAPFAPGFLLSALTPVIDRWPAVSTGDMVIASAMVAVFAIVLAVINRLNARAACQLRETIAALD
ncbi:hypothetical protein H8M03_03720 [Sphingomonas sabuli]|uniref:Uncharacterized protein n=1 Tax=Sphingomonas sabuli TaxID=2764186 RepID=A0A7G9L4A5_9SPHN|nr:hypothetical protein [Sphingomonas sabuli]QNM83454.1 hypothetical protein H8M03_03720 [Sphingomonas sabuli]